MTTADYKHLNKFLDRAIVPELHEDCMRLVANYADADSLINDGFTWLQIIDASGFKNRWAI